MITAPPLRRLAIAGTLLCTTACTPAAPERSSADSTVPAPITDAVAPAAADAQAAMASVFAAFDLAPARAGTVAAKGDWHLVADGGGTNRVYLMHRITAIALPPGPVTATEPVALFQHEGGRWRMLPPLPPAAAVPDHIIAALAPALADTTRTYAFLVRTVDLTTRTDGIAAQLSTVRAAMEKQSAAILTNGFLSADAEP
jgi:hypothetical protein